jgi:hypothetical protein
LELSIVPSERLCGWSEKRDLGVMSAPVVNTP